uniref:USP domain-containing protein n=1 Tax=Caenorhabditis japonica TaxID=281687 RepID=A0A8R1ITN6_CAEJA
MLAMMEEVYEKLQPLAICPEGDEEQKNVSLQTTLLCLFKKVGDVLDVTRSLNNTRNTREVFEELMTLLPVEISSWFTRETSVRTHCTRCKDRKYFNRKRSILWLDDEEDPMSGPLHGAVEQHCSRARRSGKVFCDKAINGSACGGEVFEDESCGESSTYFIVGQPNAGSSYDSLKSDPVQMGKHRFLLIGAIALPDPASFELPRMWYRSPASGWMRSDNGGVTVQAGVQLQMIGLNIFVWVQKSRKRMASKAKSCEGEQIRRVVDDFADIRNELLSDSDIEPDSLPSSSPPYSQDVHVADDEFVGMKTDPTVLMIAEAIKKQAPPTIAYLLLPNNSGTDCFVNTVANLLYAHDSLRQAITIRPYVDAEKQHGALMSAFYELSLIFARRAKSSTDFRLALPPQMHRDQQDIRDVLYFIFEKVELTDDERIKFIVWMEYQAVEKCERAGCGHTVSSSKSRWHSSLFIANTQSTWNLERELQNKWCPETKKCPLCEEVVIKHNLITRCPMFHMVIANQGTFNF